MDNIGYLTVLELLCENLHMPVTRHLKRSTVFSMAAFFGFLLSLWCNLFFENLHYRLFFIAVSFCCGIFCFIFAREMLRGFNLFFYTCWKYHKTSDRLYTMEPQEELAPVHKVFKETEDTLKDTFKLVFKSFLEYHPLNIKLNDKIAKAGLLKTCEK